MGGRRPTTTQRRRAEEHAALVAAQTPLAELARTVACPICGAAVGAPCQPADPIAYCYSRLASAKG